MSGRLVWVATFAVVMGCGGGDEARDAASDDADVADARPADSGADAADGDADVVDADTLDADPGDADVTDADVGDADLGDADVGDADVTDADLPDATPDDAGPGDSGPTDAGPADSGPVDSGPVDSGPTDAGPVDAGPVDSGPADAGLCPSGAAEGASGLSNFLDVHRTFVAIVGRPPTLTDLTYYAQALQSQPSQRTTILTNLGNMLANTPEFQSGYPSTEDRIRRVFANLFGRVLDPGGVSYWSNRLTAGLGYGGMVLEMVSIATGDDASTAENRTNSSSAFTASLNTSCEISSYASAADYACARTYVLGVTDLASYYTATETTALNATVATCIAM